MAAGTSQRQKLNDDEETQSDFIAHWLTATRFFLIMEYLDRHIRRNLNKDAIETRTASSNGLWCCFLLPTILVVYSALHEVSELYKILACLSVGLFFSSALFIVFMSVSCSVLKENINAGCAASGLVSTLFLFQILDQGFIFSVVYSFVTVYMFMALMRLCLNYCPKTFTIGEALIVVQGAVLLFMAIYFRTVLGMGDTSDEDMAFILDVNVAILLSVVVMVSSLFILEEKQRDMKTFCYLLVIAGIFGICMLHVIAGYNCIMRIAVQRIFIMRSIQLILFWLVMTSLAAVTLYFRTKLNVKATTVTRKVFHILASLVFLSGIVTDVYLMTLAAGVGFSALVLAETVRKCNIRTASPALEAAFQVYKDEKDIGTFAMTAMYLYIGLACPLLLVPFHNNYHLELLSGVLSIGVGDTAASWFGAKYGFNKWADGHKSMEGTAFNILSQIAVVYALEFLELIETEHGMLRTIFASFVSGLVEAKICQIDNLVVPLTTIIAYQSTYLVLK